MNPAANSPERPEASDGKLLVRVEVRDSERLTVGLRGAGPREVQHRLSIVGENR